MVYRLDSEKSVEEVTSNLEKHTPENNFRVLAIHDVQATLAEKGIEREPLKIVEVCSAGFADRALKAHIDVALFMPCRFVVHTEDGKTVVKLNRPSMIAEMIPGAGLEDIAGEAERILKKIMEASV